MEKVEIFSTLATTWFGDTSRTVTIYGDHERMNDLLRTVYGKWRTSNDEEMANGEGRTVEDEQWKLYLR